MHIEQKTNRIFRPTGNTTLAAEETNQITTEIENQITAGGLTPNAGTLTQLRDSIQNVVDTAANELQEQIDAITSSSDVFDVVGTYAQLQAYDTATVPVNDIIKVLQDETRQNAMTYYRWNGTTWVFIGAEGPYYTVSETDTKFALKTQLPGVATTQQAGLVKPDGQSVLVGQDGTISVAQSVAASMPLFTCQFTDHLLNDASYLRADTFSWQSGSVYISAYQHLVSDISGITSETETISGTTVTFYRSSDGHKICLANQESNIQTIYTATGVAWYYILDTTNTRFKLPRTKFGFNGLRADVGNYIYPTLPNITGTFSVVRKGGRDNPGPTGAFTQTTWNARNGSGGGDDDFGGTYTLDASLSNPIYQNGATVQQAATQMYLYFYVGNTVQNQTTIDVGQITETLNSKAETALSNVTNTGTSSAAGWAMPSNVYTNLTLGASDSTYTAPANGWFVLEKIANGVGQEIRITNESNGLSAYVESATNSAAMNVNIQCKKGDVTRIYYSAGGNTLIFRFVYAEGSKSEAN